MSESPDSILSERILKKLEDSDVLTKEILDNLKKEFPKGNLKNEDWILLVEKELEKARGKQHGE